MAFTDKPIITNPFDTPQFHYELDDEGQPTGKKLDGRRESIQIVPVPAARRRSPKQQELGLFDEDGAKVTSNALINEIRKHVDQWQNLPPSQWGVTPETQRLMLHWREPSRARRLFFCQREAVETLIYLTEVAPTRFRKQIEDANAEANPGMYRLASKMATGSGKTTVMAMIIAWQSVNKARRPNSKSFTDAFLIIAPGITIKDRLQVLNPSNPENVFETLNLIPLDMLEGLRKARIVITNYHAFMKREKEQVSKLNRQILGGRDGAKSFEETEGEMIARVAPELMGRKNIVVLNDEAHHCYRHKVGGDAEPAAVLTAEEKKEAENNEEAARVWINGIEAFNRKIGVRSVFDVSATPFFLRGSGYPEGTLFPWVVSDFGLLDAIESGIVKVPRLPVLDDSVQGDLPKFRDVYKYVSKGLPKKGRGKQAKSLMDPQSLPHLLLQATKALYHHYETIFDAWAAQPDLGRPPVFIVVCNNTATSKLMADWISGYEVTSGEGENIASRLVSGDLPLFSNVDENGKWKSRRRTLLVDSEQLEAGDALSDEFRAVASNEIEAFKKELRLRNDPRDPDKLSDADILREVMNTVGRPGKLGADIRCVVSVSMLTEGWDTNTVTHVLGVRAFGTQLLCEQVIGRALRRQSYELNEEGLFNVEYADVLGIPFDFNAKPVVAPPQKPRETIQVKAVRPDRDALEIRFPRVQGYRAELPEERLTAEFNPDSVLELTPDLVGATETRNSGIIGETVDLNLAHTGNVRRSQVVYELTSHLVLSKWRDANDEPQLHLFGQLKRIAREWLDGYLVCKGGTTPAQLKYKMLADMACERITAGITRALVDSRPIKAVLDPYNPTGSTAHVNFNTSKTERWETSAKTCQLNWVVLDSDWEAEFCRVAEAHPRVKAYVKNHNLGFEVPYRYGSEMRQYRPDFIVRVDDGRGPDDPLNLVVEIKGYRREDAKEKKSTMDTYWVPGVNHLGTYGRWAFAEFTEMYQMQDDFAKRVEGEFNKMINAATQPQGA